MILEQDVDMRYHIHVRVQANMHIAVPVDPWLWLTDFLTHTAYAQAESSTEGTKTFFITNISSIDTIHVQAACRVNSTRHQKGASRVH